MQPRSARPADRLHQPSGRIRGYAGRRPVGGGSAVTDAGTPAHPDAPRKILRDNSSKKYDSIAVVVGRKSGPRHQRLQLPTIRLDVGRAVHRTAARCAPLLKRVGDFFSGHIDTKGLDQVDDGLTAYILRSFESERRAGLRVLAAALLLIGGWATFVPLSGAVVIPGTVVAESNIKKIQHPTGGIIASISVRDGTRVREGDILARLDDTQVRANFQMVSQQLEEIRARISRLKAERDGHDGRALLQDASLTNHEEDGERPLTTENALLRARADARKSQRELVRNRIGQLNEEIAGLDAQIKSKQTQSELIGQELEGVQALYDKRLTTLTRLTSLQREAARLDGERGQLVSSIAETRAKISESELQLVKLDQDFRADVVKDLREAQDKEAELAERVVAARDQLNHIELRAPTAGIIHQLSVHTIGGVVRPAEVIMVLVPESDELQIDARLPANEVDQVHKGQSTLVRFSAFNQRTTPELSGIVSHVSADITQDAKSNSSYYTVRVSLPGDELARLSELQLISGMPAEVFVQTGSRTMMSYLFKPIGDQLHRMFRER
ncbi:MAG TPA: HlyD family type I secretion periplasmic adaptor subunit [Xanthobacteraceae bacterium]|nr:HlyD family type I secretion periplasmic adaptor subunit [Xanthobacteraceae bacterium]